MPELPHEGEHLAAAPAPVQQPAAAPSAVTDSQLVDWIESHKHWLIIGCDSRGWTVGRNDNFHNYATNMPTFREAVTAALRAAPGAKL